jgi:alpha-1,2-mannosyltransferase
VRGRREVFIGVFALAVLLRLIPVLIHGGLGFWNGYDDGVYYASADALTFGHLPYRDFVLLHPPGITVLLVPFAALGRVTTDATGMILARCFFIALGAINASLVAAIAWRWSGRAGVIAGVVYACWYPAVVTEQSARLEVVGTTALLVALLLLVRLTPTVRPRHELLAGAALGLGAGLKIWGAAPWLVLLLWELLRQRWAAAGRLVAGGSAALAVLLLPFFVAAPIRMFDMVIRDQFRRAPIHPSEGLRLSSIFGIDNGITAHHAWLAVVVGIVLVAAVLVCLRDGLAQPIVMVLAGNLAVLLSSPSFFRHYAEFVAAPAVLLIGIAADRVSRMVSLRRRAAVVAPVIAGALALASGIAVFAVPAKGRLVDKAITTAAPKGCLTSDDPGVLIQMNRLSQDFRDNCRFSIDVWGTQQDLTHTSDWQPWLVRYLASGGAFIVARPHEDDLTARTLRELASYPLLADAGGITLRRGNGR